MRTQLAWEGIAAKHLPSYSIRQADWRMLERLLYVVSPTLSASQHRPMLASDFAGGGSYAAGVARIFFDSHDQFAMDGSSKLCATDLTRKCHCSFEAMRRLIPSFAL